MKSKVIFIVNFTIAVGLMSGCGTSGPFSSDTSSDSSKARPSSAANSGVTRVIPNPIDFEIPAAYYNAIEEGTRTESGAPGENYWQQWTRYKIDVELVPADTLVKASGSITYFNRSPDTLGHLVLELAQNIHKSGVPRKENAEITGGIDLQYLEVDELPMDEIRQNGESVYDIDSTRLFILLDEPLAPGDSVHIQTEWAFKVPQQGAGGRMGHHNGNLFFIAYWYPQMAVYDDVFGWFSEPFLSNAEFYHGFAEYEVNITAPEQWLVRATGDWLNPEETLAPPVFERYRKAVNSDTTVKIVSPEQFGEITATGQEGKLTWKFTADNVRDFAFSATTESIWEGTRTPVVDRNADGEEDYVFVDVLYRESAPKWKEAVKYAQHSITSLSEVTAIPYPWPHMTSVEGGGIIGGGMEFPMMTIIGSYNYAPQEALYYVIAHEFAHMWVPMIVSTNERLFSWMDEGTTTFNEAQARKDYFPESDPEFEDMQSYLFVQGQPFAGSILEGEIMRWSDYHYPGPGFGVASYPKPSTVLKALREVLGEDVFYKAYHTFLDRWKFKHPYPWDLFRTFEDVSGRDLGWFWRSWYYETWVLDHAVVSVKSTGNETRILIKDHGQIPMPAEVVITLENGRKITRIVNVETWLKGAMEAEITITGESPVRRVVIDPDNKFPDVNRDNNKWGKQ